MAEMRYLLNVADVYSRIWLVLLFLLLTVKSKFAGVAFVCRPMENFSIAIQVAWDAAPNGKNV